MTKMLIATDSRYDVVAAGFSPDEADDLHAAWAGALDWLAEQLGLDVDSTRDQSRATRTTVGADDYAEGLLWQAAHDCVSRSGSEPGDMWQWDERPSAVAALRKSLASLLPESQ